MESKPSEKTLGSQTSQEIVAGDGARSRQQDGVRTAAGNGMTSSNGTGSPAQEEVRPSESVQYASRRGRHAAIKLSTFRALSNPSFKYLWIGQIGNSASLWMEQVVRPLLVLELTGSPLLLGLVVAARTVPQLVFGLFAGVAADRYDKRKVLIYAQSVMFLMHLTLGTLLVTHNIQIWQIFATAVLAGVATSFLQPTRQSLIPRLVPPDGLLNAVALNSAAGNVMRVVGASLAGLLLIAFDYGEVYLVDALIYAGIIATTFKIHVPKEGGEGRVRGSVIKDLFEGLRYVRDNRTALYLVATALILFIFGQPYQQVFIPLLAVDVLGVGRSWVGAMLAITGVGAFGGSMIVASRSNVTHRGMIMLLGLIVFSLALILLAQSRWLPLSMVGLIIAGSMSTTYLSFNNSLLLEKTPPELHGRVMSLLSLDRGLVSLGSTLGGALAQFVGPQWGLTMMAGICLVLSILALMSMKNVRSM